MDDARIKDVSSLLAKFFDEATLKRGGTYAGFLSSWPSIVGSRLASHSRVADVDKGMLVVEAEHPGWIQLLQLRQSGILEAVAGRFPELELRGIVFRLAKEAPRAASGPTAGPSAAADGAPAAESIPEAPAGTEGIKDPELRARLQGLKDAMRGGDRID